MDDVKKIVYSEVQQGPCTSMPIEPRRWGNDAGIVGAAFLDSQNVVK